MRRTVDGENRATVIVLGSDHVASAVAHRLHGDGFAVVLIDGIDPPWPRRGMAFTDAWYLGTTVLAGLSAVFCASVRSIPAILERRQAIVATTWSWAGVAGALAPAALIDTRVPSARMLAGPSRLSPLLALEIVPGAVTGPGFDVAVEATPEPPGPRERTLVAPCAGRFTTRFAIGDTVRAGETVGGVATLPIVAPIDGCLRGLSARGARVATGREVAEIDPRGDPRRCFGIEPQAGAIAAAVSRALARDDQPLARLFG